MDVANFQAWNGGAMVGSARFPGNRNQRRVHNAFARLDDAARCGVRAGCAAAQTPVS
jgi:hypothetical protein